MLETGVNQSRHEFAGENWFEYFETTCDGSKLAAAWDVVRDEIMAAWIKEFPGKRPHAWWVFDAPRWQRVDLPARCRDLMDELLSEYAEPRRRLGGIGTPAFEVLNYKPDFLFGIPTAWVSTFDEAYFNGRALDIHGKAIGTEYHEGHFVGMAPRADDPPRFESQAAYLERHSLFVEGERARLPREAFEPESLDSRDDEEDDEGTVSAAAMRMLVWKV